MKSLLLAVAFAAGSTVLAAASPVAAQADIFIQRNAYTASGLQANWSVSLPKLEQQPIWHPQEGEAPYSAAAGAQKALSRVRDRFPEIKGWIIRAIDLRNIQKGAGEAREHNYPDRWFYSIEIAPQSERDTELLKKSVHLLVIVVLLDGSVVEPTFAPMYDAQ